LIVRPLSSATDLDMLSNENYDSNGWLSDVVLRRTRLLRLKRYCLLYGSFAALLQSRFDDAFPWIETLHALNHHFDSILPQDMTFTYLFGLLIAIQNHYMGRFDVAIKMYSQIPPQAGDIHLLALLNKCAILRAGTSQEVHISLKLLEDLERRILSNQSSSPQLKAAYSFVRGVTHTEILRSKYIPYISTDIVNSYLACYNIVQNYSIPRSACCLFVP
jgi:hypothetical protein